MGDEATNGISDNLRSRYRAPDNTAEWLDLLDAIDEAEDAGRGGQ